MVSNSVLFSEPVAHIVRALGQEVSNFWVAEVFRRNTPVITVGTNSNNVIRSPAHVVGDVLRSNAKHCMGSRALGKFPKSHRAGTTTHFSTVVVDAISAVLVPDLNVVSVLVSAVALGLSDYAHVPETS